MKIIVFDDDPTGSQTVYGCPLLLQWNQNNLRSAIKHPSSLLFLLGNTRSLAPDLAMERTREMCKQVLAALRAENMLLENIVFVSRGDSTLRGHGVIEPEVMNEALGPFDATFHIPAFFEGGRTTLNGVHLLHGAPVHTSPFARDSTFAYSTSHLNFWLEEKSGGRILAENVESLPISFLDSAVHSSLGWNSLIDWLSNLSENQLVVVDAELPAHLAVFGKAVRTLLGKKRFLYRSAASLINGLANLPPNPCTLADLASLRLRDKSGYLKPGLVLVGSYVPLADSQLEILLENDSCVGIELPVHKIASALDNSLSDLMLSDLEMHILEQLNNVLADCEKTPVLFSSRGELRFHSQQERIDFGNFLAEFMSYLVSKVSDQLGYIISKGGITTHYLLEKGLNLSTVNLKGQLLPGLSIVSSECQLHQKGLPIVTFPGNLGDKKTLESAWKLMEGPKNSILRLNLK